MFYALSDAKLLRTFVGNAFNPCIRQFLPGALAPDSRRLT
ncbi:hypothetical protein CEV32_4599 [Brucella rhizosphaerae]|uniref:Uncharacterized protein n=1 Tax=Brucella rhizosphaerae TaxID=571254 RepID=A0A256FKG4_9HYPH|nr:hypothetical protein CEV32_4599 [Brucella rhizosphaerae]